MIYMPIILWSNVTKNTLIADMFDWFCVSFMMNNYAAVCEKKVC